MGGADRRSVLMRITRHGIIAAITALVLTAVVAGCGGDDSSSGSGAVVDQVITVNWGTEPPSLDPGLASDTTSADVISNIMDPLIKLDEDLNPVPNLAESWDVSEDGKTVTLKLRDDGQWTNGDPVTAQDFEWSWKRTISPDLAADYA
jgi:oligopeptide transport system substrate-binding protein